MRTVGDRIRHTISFEIIGILLVLPFGAWLFGLHLVEIGVIGVGSSLIAALWNYAYNLMFDLAMLRLRGRLAKSFVIRVLHAVLFEVGLLIVLMPLIALYLDISLWEALLIDGALAIFYMVYALAFNWAYDHAFPLPEASLRHL